ncbi:MAG: secretion system protein E, partial [Thaumarchaeota archaeon]|nr:secretion system protein E [Nitrososphaerota archaeon]
MKEKSKQTNEIENFLTSQIIDEDQNHIPSGYEIVKNYPLEPPFSYVNILYNQEKSTYLYFVDESKLNQEETAIFQKLYRLLEESLESPTELKNSQNFDDHLNMVLKENEKMFM